MGFIGNQPAETPVKEILETDIKIGEDDQTKIDFADANTINFHANNAKEMVLAENSLTPGTSDGTALGTTSLMWSDLFLASGGVMNFNNGNVTITHTNGTGLTINSTNKLMFGDAASFVQQSSDGVLRIDGEATVDINASTAVTVSNDLKLDSDSAVLGFGADNDTTLTHTDGTGLTLNSTNKLTFGDAASFIQQSADGTLTIDGEAIIDLNASTRVDVSGALTAGGIIKTDDTTNATSTTDGSLQTDGGLSVVLDAIFGDDVSLLSDSAVLNLGAGNDVTITHDGTTGGTISGTPMAYETLGGGALANNTHGGVVIEFLAGESLAVGDWVYMSTTDGRVNKADSNDTGDDGHYPAIGVAVSAQGSAGSAVKILTHGVYNDSDGFGGDLTEGKQLFLSETAGTVTATAPSDDGDIIQVCGIAIGPRDVFVNPSLDIIERD